MLFNYSPSVCFLFVQRKKDENLTKKESVELLEQINDFNQEEGEKLPLRY